MPNQEGPALTLDRALWYGRTYRAHSASTAAETSPLSSKKQSEWWKKKFPIFCRLKKDGLMQAATWETDGQLLGEFSTLSFGECPSAAAESRLSQILEVNAHQKYCLSAKACQGILNRAARRNKELPEMLRIALEHQAACCVSIHWTANQQDAMTQMEYGIHSTQMKTEDNQGILCSACKETESTEQTPQDATEKDGQTKAVTL